MKNKTKSKIILSMFLAVSTFVAIIFNGFKEEYVNDNKNNSKNDIISDLRNASGGWDPQINRFVGEEPFSIFIEDANNDGYNDIVTANSISDDISILLWNNALSDWDPQITKSVGEEPYSIFIGDANNDGYNDIVTANSISNDISIFLWNNVSNDWNPQITKSVGNGPHSIFIADANNDGYNDIATANLDSNNVSIITWNNILSNWNPQITKSVGNGPSSIFIKDADNDSYNDIVTSNYWSGYVSILLWNNVLSDWDSQISKSVGDLPTSVFIGDINNDGYNDITTTNSNSDNISIILWNSFSSDWDPQITKSVGEEPYSIFIGDTNNDGYNDIVTANLDSSDVSIILWNSASSDWDPQITKSVGSGPSSIFIGDVNSDGYNDITTANYGSSDLSILLWKPPYISILSPENKLYGPLEGYYPATYGFDNDKEGESPRGWTSVENGGVIQVISDFNNHHKVVKLDDSSDIDGNDLRITIDVLIEGRIEFWMGTDDVSKLNEIDIWNSNDLNWGIQLGIQSSKFRYKQSDNNWYDIPNVGVPMNNKLHHWSVHFNFTTHKFHVFVDSIDSGELNFKYPHNNFDRFQFHTSITETEFSMYVDAIGFSWDSAYNVGDNLNEGMRLGFYNNTYLDWIAYSLDGSANKTIFEQEIIPLPEDGPHSIQLFGRDIESGEIIESEIQDFIVDGTNPEIIIVSPKDGETFGDIAPKFLISVDEVNLNSIWYTLDNGLVNISCAVLGRINQDLWNALKPGNYILRFYANDTLGNEGFSEISITKKEQVISVYNPIIILFANILGISVIIIKIKKYKRNNN